MHKAIARSVHVAVPPRLPLRYPGADDLTPDTVGLTRIALPPCSPRCRNEYVWEEPVRFQSLDICSMIRSDRRSTNRHASWFAPHRLPRNLTIRTTNRAQLEGYLAGSGGVGLHGGNALVSGKRPFHQLRLGLGR